MKISRERLKQIIKEELEALALAESDTGKMVKQPDGTIKYVDAETGEERGEVEVGKKAGSAFEGEEEEGEAKQSPERKRGERLKSKLFTTRTGAKHGGAGDARRSAMGGRTMQPGEELESVRVQGADASEKSQDAGLYMTQGRFDPTDEDEASAVGMYSPKEMAASKLAKKDYGKGIPDYMRAGYKGDAPLTPDEQQKKDKAYMTKKQKDLERQRMLDVTADARSGKPPADGKFVGTKWVPGARAGKKAWKSANRAMKAAAKAAGKTWQTIGPNEKTELGKQAWKAKLAARKAYKSMKSGKAASTRRAVAKKLPLPKLRIPRRPGDVQGLVDRGVKGGGSAAELTAQAGSEAKPTGLASVGVKKSDTAVAKAPTEKPTRKRTLDKMTQTELDGVRRELAAGNIPDDDDAKRIYDNQVRKNIANLRKTNPNLSVNGRRIKAQIRAKKQIIKAANTMIARKNKRERDRARTNMSTGVDLE